MKNFKDTEFVIFDVETTGLSPRYGDRIIEIAALKVKGLKAVDRFHSLIDPQRAVSYGAFQVNRISSQMLRGAPTAAVVIPDFMRFWGEACLVGHNIGFDLGFLANELSLMEHPVPESVSCLDTVRMARGLLPEIGSFRLLSVAQWLGIDRFQQHRAMADVEMTFKVFRQLLEIADRRDVYEVEQLLTLYGQAWQPC